MYGECYGLYGEALPSVVIDAACSCAAVSLPSMQLQPRASTLLRHSGPTLQPRSLRGIGAGAGNHEPGQTVSWTGTFTSRRQLLGLTLRWSYAPGEIKVLTSADGGNFQESVGWSKLSRSEPSFEDTVVFPEPVAAKAVKVLMRRRQALGILRAVQRSCDVGAFRLHARERCSSSPRAMPCGSWRWCGCKALRRCHCGWHGC